MTPAFYGLAVAVTLSIGLHLCVASGHIGSMLGAGGAVRASRPEMPVICRSIGLAVGIAGYAFQIGSLTMSGVALVAASITLLPRQVPVLPANIDLPLMTLSVIATACLAMVRGIV